VHISDIEKQLPPIFDRFYHSLRNRTCQACGTVAHKRP
jgi:3-hydroxyanthranilate 3,4-dioxygenase